MAHITVLFLSCACYAAIRIWAGGLIERDMSYAETRAGAERLAEKRASEGDAASVSNSR